MFDLKQFGSALAQISEEKGISPEKVLETIEMAIAAAYKKEYGKKGQMIRAKLDPKTGTLTLFQVKLVVEESMLRKEDEEAVEAVESEEGEKKKKEEAAEEYEEGDITEKKIRFNPERHLMLEEAKNTKADAQPGDELEFELEAREEYGRIAAQTAKQVIIQRIREAEREAVFNEYKDKEGELVSGIVQRIEGRNVFIDVGKTTGVMFPEEQVSGERYRLGQRLKFYVVSVTADQKGPGIVLSRSHPNLINKLFELEVPEIGAGTVEIKAVAREAGNRSKIAVASLAEGVDPVGSCVGQRGTRVTAVISELGGEKIDIIEWNHDTAKFIAYALSPAKVVDVELIGRRKEARAQVPEDQLSLAIGRGGQNVRLAAKLTGWKIDVVPPLPKAEGEAAEPQLSAAQPEGKSIMDLEGVGAKTAELLAAAGYATIDDLAKVTAEDLEKVEGIGPKTAQKILEQVK